MAFSTNDGSGVEESMEHSVILNIAHNTKQLEIYIAITENKIWHDRVTIKNSFDVHKLRSKYKLNQSGMSEYLCKSVLYIIFLLPRNICTAFTKKIKTPCQT